jgi:hypothetical protein
MTSRFSAATAGTSVRILPGNAWRPVRFAHDPPDGRDWLVYAHLAPEAWEQDYHRVSFVVPKAGTVYALTKRKPPKEAASRDVGAAAGARATATPSKQRNRPLQLRRGASARRVRCGTVTQ